MIFPNLIYYFAFNGSEAIMCKILGEFEFLALHAFNFSLQPVLGEVYFWRFQTFIFNIWGKEV